jgi:hypothetical protein
METFKYEMVDLLQLYDSNTARQYLDQQSLWDIGDSIIDLTFIDIIKGFVPGFLTDRLYMLFKNRQLVLDTLLIFYEDLFNNLENNIWRPRCDAMISKEQSLNINNRVKRKKSSIQRSNPLPSSSRSDPTDIVDYEYGLELEIRLGGKWLGFTMSFNHCNIASVVV